MPDTSTIIYTHTDEAPALATCSFLPVIRAFCEAAGIAIETRDISLSGRILSHFRDRLDAAQQVEDALTELGRLAVEPEANIIKLPNISASIPQIKAAIAELQDHGYDLPDYPEEPSTDEERDARARYDTIKGSAVNPVLRQGNSDRRAPKAVKEYARAHPHPMGAWTSDSLTDVTTMSTGDFRNNEQSVTVPEATTVRIEHVGSDGSITVLKDSLDLLKGEVIDGTFMSRKDLVAFLEAQVDEARKRGVLFSLHMKATMMKVSDPIIFRACRPGLLQVVSSRSTVPHSSRSGVDVNNGFGDLSSPDPGPSARRSGKPAKSEADIQVGLCRRPEIGDGRFRSWVSRICMFPAT